MPALTEAWRPGFWPCAPVRICPMITSETSLGATSARFSTSLMAIFPSSCAGRVANAPLKLPTGVRAPDTIITSVIGSLLGAGCCCSRSQNAANARQGKLWQICLLSQILGRYPLCRAAEFYAENTGQLGRRDVVLAREIRAPLGASCTAGTRDRSKHRRPGRHQEIRKPASL